LQGFAGILLTLVPLDRSSAKKSGRDGHRCLLK
jgi:hypothetical protein